MDAHRALSGLRVSPPGLSAPSMVGRSNRTTPENRRKIAAPNTRGRTHSIPRYGRGREPRVVGSEAGQTGGNRAMVFGRARYSGAAEFSADLRSCRTGNPGQCGARTCEHCSDHRADSAAVHDLGFIRYGDSVVLPSIDRGPGATNPRTSTAPVRSRGCLAGLQRTLTTTHDPEGPSHPQPTRARTGRSSGRSIRPSQPHP